ncbi:fad-dependent thymidylate synthase [Lasius niger]|uniref:Fad-dependent thymidylate synthase n=1 Tax=Lasius niger TaxID=67767 RepID=A0A0J7NM28_LASNI|nr:fad-dependent thymidylate synthase [Lasius niger]
MLDHGFLRVVDYMGDDAAIVQAARVSYGRGTKKSLQDKGLIRYLMRHRHTTPFEMCEIKFHVKMPIFVARQWLRHRMASVNEYSARYSVLDNEFYLPAPDRIGAQSDTNHQGTGDQLSPEKAEQVLELLRSDAERCYRNYETMMGQEGEEGLARELARINLTVGTYTQFYWKIDLHNLLHFVSLRADPHAQYEIQVYALKILEILDLWVPFAAEAFREYRLGARTLSAAMVDAVKRMIAGEKVTAEDTNMSKREWAEMCEALDLKG